MNKIETQVPATPTLTDAPPKIEKTPHVATLTKPAIETASFTTTSDLEEDEPVEELEEVEKKKDSSHGIESDGAPKTETKTETKTTSKTTSKVGLNLFLDSNTAAIGTY